MVFNLNVCDYMYIYVNMANLQKCSRCKSTIDISFFGLNRKKEPYKTCEKCRSEKKTPQPMKITYIDFVDGIDNENKKTDLSMTIR